MGLVGWVSCGRRATLQKLKNKKSRLWWANRKAIPSSVAKETCIYIGRRALRKGVVEVILPSDKKETPLYSRVWWKGKKNEKKEKESVSGGC